MAWLVETQAYGGHYWESASFGPFRDREAAEAFVEECRKSFEQSGYIGHPGYVVKT